ncbi:protein SON [Enoplosus armatus]|uniref:protein SON n=1 Tax=Enoplosus armatus TaxID=215367 RepID=UPI0039943650
MAANIEQILQDFILNKIREIEDQNEDKAAAEGAGAGAEMAGAEKATSERDGREDSRGGGPQKKHKKHKRHKSDDGESKSRCHKRHSTGKRRKKKKRRRRKGEENSSDSDSKRRDSKRAQSVSPRRREELPDIIPKQGEISLSVPPPPPPEISNSLPVRLTAPQDPVQPSLIVVLLCPANDPFGSSCEKRGALDGSVQPTQGPSKGPQPPQLASSPARGNIKAEELTELSAGLRSPDHSEQPAGGKEEKAEDTAQTLGSGAPQPTPNQSISTEPEQTTEPSFPPLKASEYPGSFAANVKSPAKKKRKPSKSPQGKKEAKSSKRQKRSTSPCRSHRKGSRSRSPSKKKRSRSRSGCRRSRRSRSRSVSRGQRRAAYSQRDRWKREPSHSPVLILRKNRTPTRKHCSSSNSPQRISELDKDQLLEIAKANAAAMCAKAGMPIPASLRSTVLPLALPSMAMNAAMASMTAATMTAALSNMGTLSSLLPLPSITNKPPPVAAQPNIAALEEVKRKVAKQANSISIKEFTDKCKMIVDSKGELPVAMPHVSDEEDDGKPFGGSALREQKAISFSINNTTVRPAVRSDAGMAKEFPVSSGSQHRKKEGEALGAYGEWVPVDKAADKAAAASRKAPATVPVASAVLSSSAVVAVAAAASGEAAAAAGLQEVAEQPAFAPDNDSVFPDPLQQPVDISQAVTERIKAQRRLAENPYDVSAICMLSRAQEQVDAWAQSNTVPGLFTGSTGAQILTSEELSTGGPQAWLKKDQFLRAAPVSGGVGEFLMRKMGWKTGEGLGRNREGTVEPIIIDFKVDRKGLVAEGEKPQKQTGGLVVTKDLMGKHPVSALIELCNKRRIMQPDFVMVHHSGPDHRKNFLFKVTVNGVDYQPQTASPNKKHAKAMAATVALQALGEVPVDGPGLYTGPVFTAASTGPLFST